MPEMDMFNILGNAKQIFIVIVQIQTSLPRSSCTEKTGTQVWSSRHSQVNEMDIQQDTGEGSIREPCTFPLPSHQNHLSKAFPFSLWPPGSSVSDFQLTGSM